MKIPFKKPHITGNESRSIIYVPKTQTISIGNLLKAINERSYSDDCLSMYESPHVLVSLGRHAIILALKTLELAPPDNILIPSYVCDCVADAISEYGIEFKCYDVSKSTLSVDLEDVRASIDNNTKAILIVHYFGFANSIEEVKNLTNERGIFLIEDCAHALFSSYSGTKLGTFGDLAIFSIRKSLPTLDGAFLLINNESLQPSRDIAESSTLYRLMLALTTFDLVSEWRMKPKSGILLRLIYIAIAKLQHVLLGYGMHFDSTTAGFLAPVQPSKISLKIMDHCSASEIIQKRREHYSYLLRHFRSNRSIIPVFKQLPDGVCPYVFPAFVEERDSLRARLSNNEIETSCLWCNESLPAQAKNDRFKNAQFISNHILTLPIHQDLDTKQLRYIVDELDRY